MFYVEIIFFDMDSLCPTPLCKVGGMLKYNNRTPEGEMTKAQLPRPKEIPMSKLQGGNGAFGLRRFCRLWRSNA